MIRLTIDGQEISVPEGTMIVDAAAKLGIEVPVYCYHEALGPLGACRMCLVKVEKMPKLATGCTTPVAEGMVVTTHGPDVEKGRAGVLEFLLINHPLDCPVCDKGGECFLQDYTYRYGPGKGRFDEPKIRKAKDAPINEFILIDQERCVLCQRCVRFMGEYVGENQLLLKGRGVETVVATADDLPVTSRFSGNVVDLCPVGALLSRPYRFKARPWNIEREESFCQQCPVGCPQSFTTRDGHIVRAEGRPIPEQDWGWQCDRGRFGYDFGYHPSRLLEARVEGQVTPVAEAYRRVGTWIREAGSDGLAMILGGRLSTEEAHQIQHFSRSVAGSERLAIMRTVPGYLPRALNGTYEDLSHADRVLLLGADPYEAVPVVHLKLRDARRHHAVDILGLGPRVLTRETLPGTDMVVDVGQDAAVMAEALFRLRSDDAMVAALHRDLADWTPPLGDEPLRTLGQWLLGGEHLSVLWDGVNPDVEAVLAVLHQLRNGSLRVLPTWRPVNWRGYEWAGVPARFEALEAILEDAAAGRIRTLVLWNADPLREYPDTALVERALTEVDHVVAINWFPPLGAERMAAVIPAAAWGEITGTYVNMEGRLEVSVAGANPPAESRPVRTVLTAFARALEKPLGLPEDWDPFVGTSDLLPAGDPVTVSGQNVRLPEASRGDGEEMAVIGADRIFVGGLPSEILEPRIPDAPLEISLEDAARLGIPESGGLVDWIAGEKRWRVMAAPDARIPQGRILVPFEMELPLYGSAPRGTVRIGVVKEVSAG